MWENQQVSVLQCELADQPTFDVKFISSIVTSFFKRVLEMTCCPTMHCVLKALWYGSSVQTTAVFPLTNELRQ